MRKPKKNPMTLVRVVNWVSLICMWIQITLQSTSLFKSLELHTPVFLIVKSTLLGSKMPSTTEDQMFIYLWGCGGGSAITCVTENHQFNDRNWSVCPTVYSKYPFIYRLSSFLTWCCLLTTMFCSFKNSSQILTAFFK